MIWIAEIKWYGWNDLDQKAITLEETIVEDLPTDSETIARRTLWVKAKKETNSPSVWLHNVYSEKERNHYGNELINYIKTC